MSQVKEVIVQGLWKNNSALVQLLGLCPLLAVTSTATNALGLGLATTLVFHFCFAPLDAVGNPYSDLCHDHCVGGQRGANAD